MLAGVQQRCGVTPTAPKHWVGKVISGRMTQTLVVEVTRLVRHPVYQRVIRRAKKFKVHDPGLSPKVGDEVRIEETRPVSKYKRWRLVEIVRRSPEAAE